MLFLVLKSTVQFLRQPTLREYTARIMHDTFRQLTEPDLRSQMFHWVVVCLPNFTQVQPTALSRWMIACTLLACTNQSALAQLLLDLLSSRANAIDDAVLQLAALAFVADADLGDDDRAAFVQLLRDQQAPLFRQIVATLDDDD